VAETPGPVGGARVPIADRQVDSTYAVLLPANTTRPKAESGASTSFARPRSSYEAKSSRLTAATRRKIWGGTCKLEVYGRGNNAYRWERGNGRGRGALAARRRRIGHKGRQTSILGKDRDAGRVVCAAFSMGGCALGTSLTHPDRFS